MTDRRLVERARAGDREAFAQIVRSERERLRRVAFGVLRDTGLADDATQQAFLEAWRDLPRLREPERFDAWLHRLLVRRCYSEAKRARRWSGIPPDPSVSPGPDPYAVVADRDQLERGFRRLSVDYRVVLVLHYYLGLALTDIAEILDVPSGTVYARLHRALQQLRGHLDADNRVVGPSDAPPEAAR